jgi:hypothetical protein
MERTVVMRTGTTVRRRKAGRITNISVQFLVRVRVLSTRLACLPI